MERASSHGFTEIVANNTPKLHDIPLYLIHDTQLVHTHTHTHFPPTFRWQKKRRGVATFFRMTQLCVAQMLAPLAQLINLFMVFG